MKIYKHENPHELNFFNSWGDRSNIIEDFILKSASF